MQQVLGQLAKRRKEGQRKMNWVDHFYRSVSTTKQRQLAARALGIGQKGENGSTHSDRTTDHWCCYTWHTLLFPVVIFVEHTDIDMHTWSVGDFETKFALQYASGRNVGKEPPGQHRKGPCEAKQYHIWCITSYCSYATLSLLMYYIVLFICNSITSDVLHRIVHMPTLLSLTSACKVLCINIA